MDPHLLDSFAARMVGATLEDFTRNQRLSASRPRRSATRRRRSAMALGTTLGVAAPAVGTVLVVVVR